MINNASSGYSHIPVLAGEIKQLFEDYTKKYILDCTLGEGGHSEFFLESFYPDIFFSGHREGPEYLFYCPEAPGAFSRKN